MSLSELSSLIRGRDAPRSVVTSTTFDSALSSGSKNRVFFSGERGRDDDSDEGEAEVVAAGAVKEGEAR